MKRIEAIICPDKVADVVAALEEAGQRGVTVSSAESRGDRQTWVHHLRCGSYRDSARERSRVEVVVTDDDAGRIVNAMRNAASTNSVDDGHIYVHDVTEVIRIRTSESGVAAL